METRAVVDMSLTSDAAEFVRYCYRRRKVGWPELYDEMCLVASRGHFRGWSASELADHGVVLSLFGTVSLALLVHRVLEAEGDRGPRVISVLARRPSARDMDEDSPVERRRTLVRALGVA
jgi:hypothetical protein